MSTSRQESTGPDPRADQPLKSVAALVSRALSGRPMVGITAYDHGGLTALDWSSPRAKLVEEAPMLCRLSPCRAAARSEHPILVTDITLEKHWADYAFEINPLGVRSLLCEPVWRDGRVIGVRTVYGELRIGLGPTDHTAVETAVEQSAESAELLVAHRTATGG
ncbi:GAF domain-containing protein [Nocardia niigatensis]